MFFIVQHDVRSNCVERLVYEQWRGSSRTIANRNLPLEIPQDFPNSHGLSNGLYTP